jgi:hypothetical protein
MLGASSKEIIVYMAYTIVIDKAVPGTAVSGKEANRFKKEIATYFEALHHGLKVGTKYGPFYFTDDQKLKRKLTFKVLKVEKKKDDETIHIEITEFLTV